MKLNPEKCAFRVPYGKFLGFLVSERGIEANPEKIKVILEMTVPHTQKDIQKLAGCLAALCRFIPKLEEKCMPFFELLKGAQNKKLVDWTPECNIAFEEVKQHLINPPILSKAKPGEPLCLYIAVRIRAISSTLVREESGAQSPVYYVSQVLKDAETRTTIKAQALAEFVMECTFLEAPKGPTTQSGGKKETRDNNVWTLYVDGSATTEMSGIGLILSSPDGFTNQQVITFAFKATNNQVEYEALLSGLRLAKSLGVKCLIIYGDKLWSNKPMENFEAYLKELGIKHTRASVTHPQGNRQVEVTNRTIPRGLEKTLEESKKNWPDELPKVLWSYRTTSRTGTGETPFKLAHGIEARLLVEIGSPSHRVVNFDEVSNIEGLKTNLELLDGVRDRAVEKMEIYKEKTKLYFAKKAKIREYEVGDLVLRDTEASDPTN
ncbi:uncharacterized protein LOC141715076 [Apium graveolens]|uniref:uncharacterized protein LOC141715076 n=1 Tax=Apium graveolens TaxID=4045 RepID=UPI003D7A0DCD